MTFDGTVIELRQKCYESIKTPINNENGSARARNGGSSERQREAVDRLVQFGILHLVSD